ncbi:hypothetical protein ACWEFL_08895 [Streptomyces sp. NPDC004838]
MNTDGERLPRGRMYDHGRDDPAPSPLRHRAYDPLVRGRLDGLL